MSPSTSTFDSVRKKSNEPRDEDIRGWPRLRHLKPRQLQSGRLCKPPLSLRPRKSQGVACSLTSSHSQRSNRTPCCGLPRPGGGTRSPAAPAAPPACRSGTCRRHWQRRGRCPGRPPRRRHLLAPAPPAASRAGALAGPHQEFTTIIQERMQAPQAQWFASQLHGAHATRRHCTPQRETQQLASYAWPPCV